MPSILKLCINPTETICDFNYAFTAALLKKLKRLKQSRQLCNNVKDMKCEFGNVTNITASVIGYLMEVTKFPQPVITTNKVGSVYVCFKLLESLIEHTEEFLAIFKIEEQ